MQIKVVLGWYLRTYVLKAIEEIFSDVLLGYKGKLSWISSRRCNHFFAGIVLKCLDEARIGEELIKEFKEKNADKHKALKDAQKELQKKIRETRQTGDRRE